MKTFPQIFEESQETFCLTNVHMWHMLGSKSGLCTHVQDGGWLEDALSVDTEEMLQWIQTENPSVEMVACHSQWNVIYSAVFMDDWNVIVVQRGPNDQTEVSRRLYKDKVSIDVVSLEPEIQASAFAQRFLRKFLTLDYANPQENRKGAMHMLAIKGGNVDVAYGGTLGVPWEPTNYPDEVAQSFEQLCQNLVTHDPQGRLTILTGPPGTGKSHFLFSLLHQMDEHCQFIMVDPATLPSVTGPNILPQMLNHKKSLEGKRMVFILEDADDLLARRELGRANNVSALLNLCDGPQAKMLDVRVLISSNIHDVDIDEAISREGRMFKRVQFPFLKREEAERVYERLAGSLQGFEFKGQGKSSVGFKSVEGTMPLSSVYAQARKSGVEVVEAPKPKLFSFSDYQTRRAWYQQRKEENIVPRMFWLEDDEE